MYVEVAVDLGKRDSVFFYEVPPEMALRLRVGMRVLVPLGRALREGYVIGLSEKAERSNLKTVIRLLDDEPVVSREVLELAQWVASNYLCPISTVLRSIVPRALKKRPKNRIIPLVEQSRGIEIAQSLGDKALDLMFRLWEKGEIDLKEACRISGGEQVVEALEEKGLIFRTGCRNVAASASARQVYRLGPKYALADLASLERRAPRQFEIVKWLQKHKEANTWEIERRFPRSSLDSLLRKGIISKQPVDNEPTEQPVLPTPSQKKAIDYVSSLVRSGQFARCLLFGVTGSGKTEVYLQVMERVLALGRRVIVLVPEIALAQQMVRIFSARVGDRLAVLHSGLSEGERHSEYQRILRGEVDIILGARSAIFAPVDKLGLIILDEEQEYAYKQENVPRYHAREVAETRARLHNAVLLVGSASPSVETFFRAETGEYTLLELPERIGTCALPSVEVVDMRTEFKNGNRTVFSGLLRQRIQECLDRREQVILFLNRRGFFTFMMCRECGLVLVCPHCSVPLAYHRVTGKLHCHYCFFQRDYEETCPNCSGRYMRKLGTGTQKVEEEVLKFFPRARVARLDTDSLGRKASPRNIVESMAKGEIDILVGTQMVAKGFDFPKVTLVGVVLADTVLNLPDFRACERGFQLLLQVAGRAGRASFPGRVVIQTYQPENRAIKYVVEHDYLSFYAQEIKFREYMRYPPFARLLRIVVSSPIERKALLVASELGALARELVGEHAEGVEILGPGPCHISKLRDRYRFQVLLKGPDQGLLTSVGRYIIGVEKPADVRVEVDVDPLFML